MFIFAVSYLAYNFWASKKLGEHMINMSALHSMKLSCDVNSMIAQYEASIMHITMLACDMMTRPMATRMAKKLFDRLAEITCYPDKYLKKI